MKVPRFCVLSLNPAIDAEWRVDDILWEEKNVVSSERRWAAGKGVNVERWLRLLGSNPELLIPLGGAAGRELAVYLRADKIRTRIIPLADETRVNVVITTRAGRQMRFNQSGARVHAADWGRILETVASVSRRVDAFILSGSLPPGAPINGYAKITRIAHRAGTRVFLDCDGPALAAAVRARPFLVKPNQYELSGWIGHELKSLAAIRAAAQSMSRMTHGWILVSMGAQGAMLVNVIEDFCAQAITADVKVKNTLGAGDATLAAAAAAAVRDAPPIEWIRAAVAAGTGATKSPAGQMIALSTYRSILRRVSVSMAGSGRTSKAESRRSKSEKRGAG